MKRSVTTTKKETLSYISHLLPCETDHAYIVGESAYMCLVPQCEGAQPALAPPPWWPARAPPRCSRPMLAAGALNCSADSFTNLSEPCDAWVYGSRNSIVAEFDLACQEWKRTLVGTVHNIGVMISMPLMGFVSDRWGRRKSIIVSGLGLAVGAFKTLTAGPGWTGYPLYMLLELLEAALVTGTYTTCFVLMLELVGKNRRVISALVLGIMIAAGELLLALIVWLVPYWRHFQLFLYCPAFIFLTYIFLLDESLRWLIVNEKNDKAVMLVQKIAKWNGIPVSRKMIDGIRNSKVAFDADVEVEKEKFHPKLLFSSTMLLKRLLVCSWWWFTAAFVYYGLLINSVSLPGNKIVNFALSSLSTLIAEFVAAYLLNKIGRKFTLLGGFLLCGVCCVSEAFIPKAATTELIVIFLLGKMCISVCFNAIYVYTSELVPTSARGCLVGACSMLARVGSVLAPLTPLLGAWWPPMPILLFGGAALTAAGATLTTPETLRRALPDTVAQATQQQQ
ncbi:solute carrier family 22 member 3-like isoform X2 [Choristoneura fumiferana]|uniref:solute carrier family 22 member 3-like isoform X2 n=2 Tax=Choristoneura fumiferana TaxID=7141 RepID=UPI003D1542CD